MLKAVRTLFTLIVIVAIAAIGGRLLAPSMAKALMRSDPLKHADVIVVLGSERLERTIEAGTLYREGWAPKILLMRPADLLRDSIREQMKLRIPVFLDVQEDLLNQMHVPRAAVFVSSDTAESTHDEALSAASVARQNHYRRIIVVTSPYHTARAGELFDRASHGSFEVIVHPDRYEPALPGEWWRRFPDRSDVVNEYLKRVYAPFAGR
jgi:uncharacterized SAM-binding protein YcdF (DUF218 family)